MKKLILPTLVSTFLILLIPFFFNKVNAQDKELIGCEELKKILGSDECPHFVVDMDVWCAQTEGELWGEFDPQNGIDQRYKNRPPDYVIDRSSDFFSEDTQKAAQCLDRPDKDEIIQSDQSQSDKVGQPTEQNQTGKDGNLFNIFGANPFQTWLNLKGLAEIAAYIGTDAVIKDAEYLLSSIERAQQKQEAESNELFGEVKFVQEASTRFGELRLQDKIRAGEIVKKYDARVEATNQPVLIKMDSGTLELHPLNGQTGVIEPESYWPMLKSGALDVIVEPQNGQQFEIQTPNMDLFVIGTEFSVIYNPKKDQTLVAVYKGQVEVKTKTGQKAIVSPKGDKPGVVLVSQKLSTAKLAIAGVVLAAVTGGVVLILKRKFTVKGSKKKKK